MEIVHAPDKLANLLGGDEPPIHLGRPGGAPAALFNHALATLQWNLENLEEVEVSRLDVERSAKYLQSVVRFYKDEAQRQTAITELINEAIGENGEWGRVLSWADNIKPDSCWWYYEFLILVLELKSTLGLAGDALFQAVIDYSKIIPQERVRIPIAVASNPIAYLCLQYKRFREYSNFPIVLVGATANRLEISTAVCVGPVYVSKLLVLDLSLGFHASNNVIRLARTFKALSRCRADLRKYYDGVNNLFPPKLSCLYPNPTSVDPSIQLPELVYQKALSRAGEPTSALVDLGNTTTAIYVATLSGTSQEVVVKFTARYNEEAHRLLAKSQLAPDLHFCGRVVGNLYMVVMDHVDGKSIWQLQEEGTPVPAVVSEKAEEALKLLHARDIVFADLRDPNIMYVASKGSGQGSVMLVDFDWPAKDGEGRYPVLINPNNTWSDDVSPYGVMRKSHDLWQLDRLKALCNSGA